jgi:4-hydroxy-3-polyprenylbenzoate decarboxylase
MNPSIEGNKDIYEHWKAAKDRGEHLPIAICLSAPPCVGYSSVQRAPYGLDELALAGGLVDAPVREVEAVTQPVVIPADADLVIEGEMRTDVLEPEAPFGESHGYMNPKEYNMVVDVTAVTRRDDALYTSFISQVTPSESSTMRRTAWQPLFLRHLRDDCNITAVKDVKLHEPLTSVRKLTVLQMYADAKPSEIWRAMYAAVSFRPGYSKITVAVDEDVDPDPGRRPLAVGPRGQHPAAVGGHDPGRKDACQ